MDYVPFGQTDLRVSQLCLGTMSMGNPAWKGWVLDETASVPLLRLALDRGINFFDMADWYSLGRNEEVVGRNLLKMTTRDKLVLATKVFYPMSDDPSDRGLSKAHIAKSIDRSLQRMGTDYVDLYVIHAFDAETPIEETMEALHATVRAGKVLEIMRLLRARKIDATIYAVGMALERNGDAAAEIAHSGFEVACHGDRWIDYQSVPEDIERAHMLRNIATITRMIGRKPVGWYTGRPSLNTRRLVTEIGGFLYDSDAYNDDLPYWCQIAGRRHLIVPHSFDTNDSRLVRGGDFSTGNDFFVYCRDAFDWLYRIGGEGRPRMMTISLHGRIIGRPGRIGALERLLDHIQSHRNVWLCNRAAIAQHWIANHSNADRSSD